MTWPAYTAACRRDVDALLKRGGSLSAYRANPQVGVEPSRNSWAWRLEREIEARFKVKHAVACNSGTGALHAAIAAALPKRGASAGEVIVSPYTFSASAAAILHAGYTPVFADVDPHTYCITPETVKKHVNKKTKAILPVSIFGGMCDVVGLKAFGVPVVEDACQAVGARNSAGYSGTQGLAGVYSMNGGKNVPAGECGAMVTNDDDVAHRARLLMNHGENFHEREVGYNYRPNELTACVAWHGLQELEARNICRHILAATVQNEVDNQSRSRSKWGSRYYSCNVVDDGHTGETWQEHAWYVFPFTVKAGTRDLFIKRMAKRGIQVSAGYIQPHLGKYKAFRKYVRGPLPVVTELSEKTLCHIPTLTPDRPLSYAREVAKAIKESLS